MIQEKIQKLSEILRTNHGFERIIQVSQEQYKAQGFPQDFLDKFAAFAREKLMPNILSMVHSEMERLYRDNEDVLDAKIEFYSSKMGQKALDIQSAFVPKLLEIQQRVNVAVEEWVKLYFEGMSDEEFEQFDRVLEEAANSRKA